MRVLLVWVLLVAAVWGGDTPSRITLPDPAVFKVDAKGEGIDWERYIREMVQPNMAPTGGGEPEHTVGTIVVPYGGMELKRTLRLSPFQFLEGAQRPGWHLGSSCGFYPSNDFKGETLIEWELPAPGRYYSAFGAGMKDLFLRCVSPDGKRRVNGARFIGSQQGSLISNVRIRGFGAERYGLALAGDTYRVVDVFVDAVTSGAGGTPPADAGSVGITTWGGVVENITGANVTVHNCAVGVEIRDAADWRWAVLETETTRTPVRVTRNAANVWFMGCKFQHGMELAEIEVQQHDNFELRMEGSCRKHVPRIELPGAEDYWPEQRFDVRVTKKRERDEKRRWVSTPVVEDLLKR